MVEFLATVVIIASSMLLFGYWFRYTCLLILSARPTRDYASEVALANRLSVLEVQSRLRQMVPSDLDRLRDLLDRDYAVIRYLLKHAVRPANASSLLEMSMLAIDYRLMGAWYGAVRRVSAPIGCRALEEMSQVVAHFANAMGERVAATSAA